MMHLVLDMPLEYIHLNRHQLFVALWRNCMPEGQMQHGATVACACVQHVMSQHAIMCCTELNAEGSLEYQYFFTADVYSCV